MLALALLLASLASCAAQSTPAPCAAGQAGASAAACAACAGATYSLGGATCAPCAPGAALVSASAGCAAAAGSAGPPGAALVFSGSQAEGFGALQATAAAGLGFTPDRLGAAGGALSVALGSSLVTAPLPTLPTAGAARSLAAWVKCAAPATPGGRALLDLSDGVAGSATEHFQLRGLLAVDNTAPGLSGIVMNGGSVGFSWNNYSVTTFAGSGVSGSADNETATLGSFQSPAGVTADAAGNVYVADKVSQKVRVIFANGTLGTLAGTGTAGSADGVGTAASFSGLYGVTIDPTGTWLAIGDTSNHRVRRLNLTTLNVTTIAGNGTAGWADGFGTSGVMLNQPMHPNFAPTGVIFIVCQGGGNVRRIDPATGAVTTLAGSTLPVRSAFLDGLGTAASFSAPRSSGIDATGQWLYVADYGNNRIRKVSTATGAVTTLVGTGAATSLDGVGTQATINGPYGIAVDGAGNLYVIDNLARKIRRVSPAGATMTIAGGGAAGSVNGFGTAATFNAPLGIWATPAGVVYVADATGVRVRMLSPPSVSPSAIVLSAPVCDGTFWHHVAATFDGAVAAVYVDGFVYSSTPAVVNTAGGAAAALGIGGAALGANEGFSGAISDVRVFSSSLSAADILALSQPPLPSYSNSLMSPPVATWGVYKYAYSCAPGFNGPSLALVKSVVDNSWSKVGGPVACAACAGATYSLGGATCAPCAPGAALVSASAGCAAAAGSAGPPGAALVFSGSQAEGFGALQATAAAGLGFTPDRLGAAGGALSVALGSSLVTAPLPTLPTAGAARSLAAWVKCAAPTTPGGRTLLDLGDGTQSSATEHLTLLGTGGGPGAAPAAITLQPYFRTTLAGGVSGYADGVGTVAMFSTPSGIALDGYNNVFVADRVNSCIRMVTPNGTTTTIAGKAGTAAAAVNGVGTNTVFSSPQGVAVDPTGTFLAVADTGNNLIRAIDLTTLAVTTITTVAPTPAIVFPLQVCFDLAGNIYFSEYSGHRVRKLTASPFFVASVVAGNGTAGSVDGAPGQLNGPRGVDADPTGAYLYIADSTNHRVRRVTLATGVMDTLAGSGAAASVDGTGSAASIWQPTGLAVDTFGSIYVIELGSSKLRKISPTGTVTTIAIANLPSPLSVVVDWLGNLFIAATGVYSVAAPARMASTVSAPVCDATWHHVAFSLDARRSAALYVDGAVAATSTAFSLNIANGSPSVLSIGAGGDEGFSGAISDVRVWATNISAGDALALSQPVLPSNVANSVVVPPGPVAGATSYSIGCAGGYAGPTLTLMRGADGSWSAASSSPAGAAALGPTSCALCGAGTWAAPNATACTTCANGAVNSTTGASSPGICASASPSPSPTPSTTVSASPTSSPTLSTTSTASLSPSPSGTPTCTPTSSSTSTPSLSSSPTPSFTASVTASQTATPSPTSVPDVLLVYSFALGGASGQSVTVANVGAPAVLASIAANVAGLLGLPAGAVRVVNLTDIATGAVTRAARRLAGGAPGSQGVAVSVAANLGKVPTQSSVVTMIQALGGANATAALGRVVTALAASMAVPAARLAATPGAPPLLANAPFSLPSPLSAAGSGSAAGGAGSAIGGAVGAVVAVGLAAAAYIYHLRSSQRKLLAARLRAAEERNREAEAVMAELESVNPLKGVGGGGAASGALVIRDLSKRNAAAAVENARLAAEAAKREEENARLAAEAAKRDEENARLRALLAQQAESIAKSSGAALATTAAPPPPRKEAFAPVSGNL